MALVIGTTGGIGCGKSTVAQLFHNLDIETLDADDLVRELSAPTGFAYPEIVALFGPNVLLPDQTLDRTKIRRRIFSDPPLREAMENILHPMVADEASHRIARWHGAYGLFIVPLLLEKRRLLHFVDRILVVDCSETQQIARVTASRTLSETDVHAIMATQCSRQERLTRADDIIDNNGNFDHLWPQVRHLDRFYRALAADTANNHKENT